ncbi:hypothetical protein DACRYDRAFT_118013 [Dacryopinax primogenitus]|uniref:cAMP-independent regulatory protein pac2 n=1 Tax=Dacryopinax primogenitus (strain DJM 731) TaxID=1858805 RepID=M5FUS5_DACPD|nr:uncharacterized protein DACRYDRAFT_118013 [Dacryopinax primogenitus]EJT99254.1 hypothetical protein DACRYDRAFT_118013 [Dacryopinax primogenitus]
MHSATVTPCSLRRPRRDRTKVSRQRPTLTGVHISSTYDALSVLNGVRLGLLQPVERRLDPEEREEIQSGCVYVYEESHGSKSRQGIERWTDGKRWSASRSKENFLFYEENSTGSEDPDGPEPTASPGSDDPNVALIDYMTSSDAPGRLTKMTFSSWVKLPNDQADQKRKWLLVCYWQKPHVKTLPKAYELEILLDQDIPRGMFFSSRAGKNKQQGLPAAGTAYDAVLRRPADLDALRWRKVQYYASGNRSPLPVGPGTRPEDVPEQYAGRGAWAPLDHVPQGPSVTDARFRYHDQHQRTFPHHRTRRDELEDIPITERPPHWRPNATGGTAPATSESSTSSSSTASPPSPGSAVYQSKGWEGDTSPHVEETNSRYPLGPSCTPASSMITSWPPVGAARPMHAISSVREQPPVPRGGPSPPVTLPPMVPPMPGTDGPPGPFSCHTVSTATRRLHVPCHALPRVSPDYYYCCSRGSAPPTPPYGSRTKQTPGRSILELALAPSPCPAERILPPVSLSLDGWRGDYDGSLISRWDRTIGAPEWGPGAPRYAGRLKL